MGNIVTNPKAFYITKRAPYEYIMKNGFSAAFANADAMPKYKGVPFALTDAREQLGRYGDCVIPVTLEGTYEVQRMQNGIDYVFVPIDSADKIHIERSRNTVRLSESKFRKIVSESIKKILSERYEPGDTLSVPPHNPVDDNDFYGNNNLGRNIAEGISMIINKAKDYRKYHAESSRSDEEISIIIDCLNRAFEAAMNLSKIDID